MTTDNPLDRAEQNLREQEGAGITYGTPEARANAKLQMAETFMKEDRQETSVTDATAGSESGNVIGSGPGALSLDQIDEKLGRLRKGVRTSESQAEIKALNVQKDAITSGMNIPIIFTRD